MKQRAAIVACAVLIVGLPAVAVAGWADNNCTSTGDGTDLSTYKKSQAKDYALVADQEGYQWFGGCWNDSNHDNQPGDPTEDPDTNGEGGDCSGFTFKTWALENGQGVNGKQKWAMNRDIHGPYQAWEFRTPSGSPIDDIAKSNAFEMEALASSSHVGMIWTPNTSQGQDRIIEAKCEDCGTLKALRNYRGDSSYEAAQRTGWTPECYPQCI